MPLTADQQAMLQLLLERGQSYADLASLLGIDEPEVRRRARAALTELGGADPDRQVGLTDYLLGQADPIGRADAARHLRDDAADLLLATTLREKLGEVAPKATLPRLPGGRATERARARPAEPRAGGLLSRGQNRLIVGLATAALLLVVVVLGVTGAFGGDGEESSDSTTTSADGAQISEDSARIPLRSASGGDATGTAIVGLASADTPFLDLTIRNLEPAPQGRTYFVWFMLGEDRGYPFTPIAVPGSGSFHDRFAIPSEYVPVVQSTVAVDVWLSPNRELGRNIQTAIQDVAFVKVPGQQVLNGPIPRDAPPSG